MSEQSPSTQPRVRAAWCSFCHRNARKVGPLAEGPDMIRICYACVRLCAAIIEQECERLGVPPKEYHD
jgi:ATP-dependent Clp protease ATP-binding subunit ClpX